MAGANTEISRRSFFAGCASGAVAAGLARPAIAARPSPAADWRSAIDAAFDTHGDAVGSAAWAELRRRFPLDPDLAYLNTAGLGPSPNLVIDTIVNELFSLERISESGHGRVSEVRQKACGLLNCNEEELAITRSTTEGMNAIARGLPLQAGDEILITTHEHPGGSMPWFALARDLGVVVRTFEPGGNPGETLMLIERALTPRTRVISISHVTCTTGYVLPVSKIAALCRNRGIFSVVDGAQAVGMMPVDLHGLGCDFYATSGHKWLLGPKGTGLLYVRRDMLETWRPTWVGAYSDRAFDLDTGVFDTIPEARSTEYGTRNTAVILGLGAAIDFHVALGPHRIAARGNTLAGLIVGLFAEDDRVEILTPSEPASAGSIITLRFPRSRMDPWEWCNTLKRDFQIRARPVGEHALNGVRVAPHLFNTTDEIERLAAAITTLLDHEQRPR